MYVQRGFMKALFSNSVKLNHATTNALRIFLVMQGRIV